MTVDAVLDAGYAASDGLRVVRSHEGYTVAVGGTTRGRLDRDAARERLVAYPDVVSNWRHWERRVRGHGTHRRAFLRWVEGAGERPVPARYAALRDGTVTRTWGEVRVTARLADDGARRYALRHVDDADADPEDIDVLDGPRALREVSETDARGRYRPLKTAPSLVDGWLLDGLDGDGLLTALDALYPVTVANWHREREGRLDVTHYRAAAERHTGIYGVVSDLSDDQVRWLAEACCVDSQCLKRREWDLTADDALDAPRGDGAFPCREPCSLVVAAAKAFHEADAGPTETVELELTAGEREQLDDLPDAVADGRAEAVREADLDDGANRYRARYLRAKHGSLGDG